MKLVKHTHATVALERDGHTLLIDPGAFTPDAAELIRAAEAVLLTHDHFDHFDENAVRAGLVDDDRLHVYGPASVTRPLGEFGDRVHTVAGGEVLSIKGFEVKVYGVPHATIHQCIPGVDNVGYLVDGTVLHPGDAYLVPDVPVDTLLIPTSGPWTKMGEAIDYVRAVRPRQCVQIHDIMLSTIGKTSADMFLGARSLTGTPLLSPAVGESITV